MESLIPSQYLMGIALEVTEGMTSHDFELEKRERFSSRRTRQ